MQPERTLKVESGQSLLFHSLKVYLNNKNRLQPIIGLSCVTECVKGGAGEVVYLCEVCVCRLSKDDAKNHIMGSLHRYNYIRVRYPHFVSEWKTNADLSKMARPLMEMAQILEKREGTGNVQVLKLDGARYEEMTAHSESYALTFLQAIKTGRELKSQSDNHTAQSECHTTQSQRIVLPPQKRSVKPKKIAVQSQKAIVHFDNHSNAVQKISVQSQIDSGGLPNAIVQSKISKEDFHGYTGTEPLIGLRCVVECRSEKEGPPYCFLCQCCDVKATNDDILDHLINPSHHFKYMMRYHAECLEGMKAGPGGISQHLQSAARKVEREEGRGQVQVMRLSSSLCSQMVAKSYQWCVEMLKYGFSEMAGSGTVKQERKDIPDSETVHDATNVTDQGLSLKRHASTLPWQHDSTDSGTATEVMEDEGAGTDTVPAKLKCSEPVFKVSLSVTDGLLLLERTPFSRDPSPEHSPTPDSPMSPSAQLQPISSEMDSGPTSPPSCKPGHTDVHTTDQDTFTDHQQPGKQDSGTDRRYVGHGEKSTSSGLTNFRVTWSFDRPWLFAGCSSACEEEGERPTSMLLDTREGPTEHPYPSRERLADNRYPSRERLADHQYPSREILADNQYPSRERLADNQYSSRERLADNQYPSRERLADNQYPSRERLADNQYPSRDRLADNQYPSGERLPDNQYPSRDRLADNRYPSRDRLADNQYPSRERLPDNRYPSRERLPDNRYPSRERLPDNRYPSRERLPDNQYPSRERRTDSRHPSRERRTDSRHPSRERRTDHRFPSRERRTDSRYPSRERRTDNRYPSRERRTDSRYPSKERLIDNQYRSEERITDSIHREEETPGDQYPTGERQRDSLYHTDEGTTAHIYTEEEGLYRSEIQQGVELKVEVVRGPGEENEGASYSTQQQYYQNHLPLQYHTQHQGYNHPDIDATGLHRHDMDVHTGDSALYSGHTGVYDDMGGGYRAGWISTGPDHFHSRSHGYETPLNTYPPLPEAHGMAFDPYHAVYDGLQTNPDLNPNHGGFTSNQLYIPTQTQGFGALPGQPVGVFRQMPDLASPPEVMSGGFVRHHSEPYHPDPEVAYVDPHFNPSPAHHSAPYLEFTPAPSQLF